MPSANIYFEEKTDLIIEKYAEKWKVSKQNAVRMIITKFDELNKKNVG